MAGIRLKERSSRRQLCFTAGPGASQQQEKRARRTAEMITEGYYRLVGTEGFLPSLYSSSRTLPLFLREAWCLKKIRRKAARLRREAREIMESPKLLVVDGDPASLGLMAEVFGSLKSNICPVSDSLKAAALVNEERFDGIFLDIELADLDGCKLPQLVRQSSWNKSTPIIVLTEHEKCDTMYKSFAMGVTFVLAKPIDRLKLASLHNALQGPLCENRRQYTRVPLQTEVECTVGPRRLTGTAWNLGQGGVQLEVAGLSCGETVEVSLRLSQPPIGVEATGVVVWAKDGRQGINFTRMSVEHQEIVREFITQLGLSPQ